MDRIIERERDREKERAREGEREREHKKTEHKNSFSAGSLSASRKNCPRQITGPGKGVQTFGEPRCERIPASDAWVFLCPSCCLTVAVMPPPLLWLL
eukprot:7065450-Pyramimonas_sp.AAC.1